MTDDSIDRLLKSTLVRGLPLGFPERVADAAMGLAGSGVQLWDVLLRLGPRLGIAVGAVAAVLLAIALSGDGPTVFEAVQDYASVSTFLSMP